MTAPNEQDQPGNGLTGFLASLANIFSSAPRPDPDRRWGSGFRRGGEVVGSGY